ncbi:MAG: hypothetical protein ABL931_02980 [Usitatibacteraceae bacterium]
MHEKGAPIDVDKLEISSPKRVSRVERGWHSFFPYYAGYSRSFANSLIASADLPSDANVLDPWNGSGTTTFCAAELGIKSEGWDINPVMTIIARARLLSPNEGDSLRPLALDSVRGLRTHQSRIAECDPLLCWFDRPTAGFIRALEGRIHNQLVGKEVFAAGVTELHRISSLASTFYVALFSICRKMVERFQSSNPTWLRKPKEGERKACCDREWLLNEFVQTVSAMATALDDACIQSAGIRPTASTLRTCDTAAFSPTPASVDLIVSSPPYCTRIDYAAATRLELAILHPRLHLGMEELGRKMIGSTRVPKSLIEPTSLWGETCIEFLNAVQKHPSRASESYYYPTHLDYFNKMAHSLARLKVAMKPNALVVLVVQDSHYKELLNDLPQITGEMGANIGLKLVRRVDFSLQRSMAGINPYSKVYKRRPGSLEAVLCFRS